MADRTKYRWIPWSTDSADAAVARNAWILACEWLDWFGVALDGDADFEPDAAAFTDKCDRYAFLLNAPSADGKRVASIVVLVQIDPDGSADGRDSVESVEVLRG